MKRFFLLSIISMLSAMDVDQRQPQPITLEQQLVQSLLQEHRLTDELQKLLDQKNVNDVTKKLLQEKIAELNEVRSWTAKILVTRESDYNEICSKIAVFSSSDAVHSPRIYLSHSAPTLEHLSQPLSTSSSLERNLPRSRSSSLGRVLSVKFSEFVGRKSDG